MSRANEWKQFVAGVRHAQACLSQGKMPKLPGNYHSRTGRQYLRGLLAELTVGKFGHMCEKELYDQSQTIV